MNINLLSADFIASTVDFLVGWVYKLLYSILLWAKDIFDICYVLVRKLAGIDTYYYDGQLVGTGEASSASVTGDLIEMLIRSDIVRNLFITLLVLGIILLFIVTFISIWKTEWEFGKDGNSKSKVINASLKALFNFITVPVVTFFGIFVGNALLRAIDDATAGGKNVNMSDIVLTSIAVNAVRADHLTNDENIAFVNKNMLADVGNGKKGIYQYFMNGNQEIVSADILAAFKNNSTLKEKGVYYVSKANTTIGTTKINQKLENGTLVFTFDDNEIVEVFFDKKEFNYVLGYIVFFIMLKTMLEITFGLVKRLFYMVFLFIVSPPIVAMSPINDKALGKWRELFISYAASSYVTLGIYNIFMSIYPLFDNIAFFPSNKGLDLLNGFVSLLFVCVGLLVVNEISKAISGLFGIKDLYSESTDKGKSLWGGAFGLAGKALKPATAPIKLAGKAAEFGVRARYQGLGIAAKGLGSEMLDGAKGMAGKAINAGPLKEMWNNAGVKGLKDDIVTPIALTKEWGVPDVNKAVSGAIKENKSEQKDALKVLGIKKGGKNGVKAAAEIQQGEKGERNKKYNQNKSIYEEYQKKKAENKKYKATAEELRAIRSMNAHKNFGHGKKHEAENTIIATADNLTKIGRKGGAVTNLVRDQINQNNKDKDKKDQTKVKITPKIQARADTTKEGIAKTTARKDAKDTAKKENTKKNTGKTNTGSKK